MMVRGAFAFLLAGVIVFVMRQNPSLTMLFQRHVILRALIESIVALTFITAVAKLPLSIIAAILQSTPIMMTLIVVIFRMEKVSWQRWAATLLGFVGVLMVVKPSTEGVSSAVWIALISALAVACRDLVTRRIPSDIPSSVITLATTLAVALMGALLGAVEIFTPAFSSPSTLPWQVLSTFHTVLLISAALLVTLGNFAIVLAFRNTDISLVSPFRYSVMIWAVIGGYFAFQEWPDWIAQIGMVLIVISGVATLRSQHVTNEPTNDPK
jgi:drug/metabolite transporter (DMT)-like permease